MTKKDYELIAQAIKEQWYAVVKMYGKGEYSVGVHRTASRIANALGKANPRFDRDKFLQACGIDIEEVHAQEVRENTPW